MDISSIIIDCNTEIIFEFMSNIKNINLWSFGIKWDINNNNKIIKGISNYNKSISYLKIIKNHKIKKIDYWIGSDNKKLTPRIYVRVESFNNINKSKLSMISFKTDDMNSDSWDRLKELHKLELLKIKELLSKKISCI